MISADEQARRDRISGLRLHTVVWEITLACNMRCIHCGSSAEPLKRRSDELTTEEAIGLVGQLKDVGAQRVVLSGGEPFMRKDWEDIAKEIARLEITPSFISNGFLVNEKVAEKLKNLNRTDTHIGLSIDGDEKVHDYIRQTKGSFKRVTNAMEVLKEKGVWTSVVTQVNMLNFKILPKIRDHIFKRGIYCWQIQLATPWGRLAKNPKLLLTPKDYMKLIEFIVEQKKIFGEKVVGADDIGYYTEFDSKIRPRGEWSGCQAGLQVLGITSNGGVTGCLSLQEKKFIEGNIRKRSLKDIWNDPDLFAYNRNFKESDLKGYCKECTYRLKCRGGCKNIAYSFSRSLHNNYYCAFRIMLGKSPNKINPKLPSGSCQYHP